jgi:hypothetical protein
MKIEERKIVKIKLTDLDALDPVTVFIEDHEKGKGEITFKCYGKSWSYYWGGMGDCDVSEFILSTNVSYIANCVWDHSQSMQEPDGDAANNLVRKMVCKSRRDDLGLSKELARELYDTDGWGEFMPKHPYEDCFKDFAENSLCEIDVPDKYTSDYLYLTRVIEAIQAGLRERSTVA